VRVNQLHQEFNAFSALLFHGRVDAHHHPQKLTSPDGLINVPNLHAITTVRRACSEALFHWHCNLDRPPIPTWPGKLSACLWRLCPARRDLSADPANRSSVLTVGFAGPAALGRSVRKRGCAPPWRSDHGEPGPSRIYIAPAADSDAYRSDHRCLASSPLDGHNHYCGKHRLKCWEDRIRTTPVPP
jgi:hypothetical protein